MLSWETFILILKIMVARHLVELRATLYYANILSEEDPLYIISDVSYPCKYMCPCNAQTHS